MNHSGDARVGARVIRIELDRCSQTSDARARSNVWNSEFENRGRASERVSFYVFGWGLSDRLLSVAAISLLAAQHGVGDLVLDDEDVGEIAIEAFPPKCVSHLYYRSMPGDAHARAGLGTLPSRMEIGTELFAHVLHLTALPCK